MSIETMKLTDPHDHPEPHTMKWTQLEMDYINKRVEAAVRAAIEQAEEQRPHYTWQYAKDYIASRQAEQEPVAWMEIRPDGGRCTYTDYGEGIDADGIAMGWQYLPLYTAPPQRKWQRFVKGVRVDGDNVIVFAGNNDAARKLCGALLEEKNT